MNNQDVIGPATAALPAPTAHGRRLPRQKHGFTRLIRGRSKPIAGSYKADRGRLQVDCRTTVGQAMSVYRADLLASLGGADSLSQQELTLIDLIVKDKMLLDTLDAYLLTVGCFSKRKKAAFPILANRMQISDSLTRKLQALGLARRARPLNSLAQLLAGPVPAS